MIDITRQLVSLLDSYVFSGIPANAVWDLLKTVWSRVNHKGWEYLYIRAFQEALRELEYTFQQYASEDGEIELPESALLSILKHELKIDVSSASFSELTDEQYSALLADAMCHDQVVIVGGHTLTEEDYAQLMRHLIRNARQIFKTSIVKRQDLFQRALLEESLLIKENVKNVGVTLQLLCDYLSVSFGVDISTRLDYITQQLAEIHQVLTSHSGIVVHQTSHTYIAQPYAHLRTHGLFGRAIELEKLSGWLAENEAPSLFTIIGMGGIGKSALTWYWFNQCIDRSDCGYNLHAWWSFYDPEAKMLTFIKWLLEQIGPYSVHEIEGMERYEIEEALLSQIAARKSLIVFDGFERLLTAYARPDASYITDDDPFVQNANHRLTATTDSRDGAFVRRLTGLPSCRLLITSRLYPADISDTATGEPYPQIRLDLGTLTNASACELIEALGLKVEEEEAMVVVSQCTQNHPLLLKVIAGLVKCDRRTPSDLVAWLNHHVNEAILEETNVLRVLERLVDYSVPNLMLAERQLLYVIASLRGSITYQLLASLVVGQTTGVYQRIRLFVDHSDMGKALARLEDIGLIGWEQQSNAYDMHPVIKEALWRVFPVVERNRLETELALFFAVQQFEESLTPQGIQDLTPSLELFFMLDRLGLYSDAWQLFKTKLHYWLWHIGALDELVSIVTRLINRYNQGKNPCGSPDDTATLLSSACEVFTIKGDYATAEILARQLVLFGLNYGVAAAYCRGLLQSSMVATLRGELSLAKVLAENAFAHGLQNAQVVPAGMAALTLGMFANLVNDSDKAARYTGIGAGLLFLYGRTIEERRWGYLFLDDLEADRYTRSQFWRRRRSRRQPTTIYELTSRSHRIDSMVDRLQSLYRVVYSRIRTNQPSDALGAAEQLIELGKTVKSLFLEAWGNLISGCILYELDRKPEAKQRINQYLSVISFLQNKYFVVEAFDMLSAIAMEDGDNIAAVAYAKQALEYAYSSEVGLFDKEVVDAIIDRLKLLGEPKVPDTLINVSQVTDALIEEFLSRSTALPPEIAEALSD